MKTYFIPVGKFAIDDLAAKRKALKEALLNGNRVPLGGDGDVTKGKGSGMIIPPGKLAIDDLAAKRKALKEALLNGNRVPLGNDGDVTKGKGSGMIIPPGKLAAAQWYENDPGLLEAEKDAMRRYFPNFELGRSSDGRLYWVGDVTPGVYATKFGQSQNKTYTLMAVYQNNHPYSEMGSSVYVYPVLPDVDDLIALCGFTPYHLLTDSSGNKYLCTAEAKDVKTGSTSTTAASVIAWAVKWLTAYELVLTGELSKEQFNTHGVV